MAPLAHEEPPHEADVPEDDQYVDQKIKRDAAEDHAEAEADEAGLLPD